MVELKTDDQWRADAKAELETMGNHGWSGPNDMPKAICAIALLLKSTPPTLLTAKGFLTRGPLDVATQAAQNRLLRGDFGVPVADDTSEALFLAAAGQLQALDLLHHQMVGTREPTVPGRDWRVVHPRGEHYLIPRGGLYRTTPPKTTKPFALKWRDLMPHHRLLPVALDNIAIELHWRHLKGAWPKAAELAAGFFEGLEFQDARDAASFVVTDVICAAQDEQIETLVAQAHEAQSPVMILPELTMPPGRIDALEGLLQDRHWAKPLGRSAPGLVMAGSWHVPVGEGLFENVAPVYDAYGEFVLSHTKLLAYNEDGIVERIRPGAKIHVLVTEDILVSFGICLDFCWRGEGAIFSRLDVDFVLITSCGDDKTMDSHLRTARDLVEPFRGRAFIVQMHHDASPPGPGGEAPPLGYVLAPSNPKLQDLAGTRTNAPFILRLAD